MGEIKKICRYFKMKKVDNLKAKTAEKLPGWVLL